MTPAPRSRPGSGHRLYRRRLALAADRRPGVGPSWSTRQKVSASKSRARSPWRRIPRTLICPLLKGLRAAGVNRLSIGVAIVPGPRPAFPEKDPWRRPGAQGRGAGPGRRPRQYQHRPDHRAADADGKEPGGEFPCRRDIEAIPRLGLYPGRRARGLRTTTATPGSIFRHGGRCSTSVSSTTRCPTSAAPAKRRATT